MHPASILRYLSDHNSKQISTSRHSLHLSQPLTILSSASQSLGLPAADRQHQFEAFSIDQYCCCEAWSITDLLFPVAHCAVAASCQKSSLHSMHCAKHYRTWYKISWEGNKKKCEAAHNFCKGQFTQITYPSWILAMKMVFNYTPEILPQYNRAESNFVSGAKQHWKMFHRNYFPLQRKSLWKQLTVCSPE